MLHDLRSNMLKKIICERKLLTSVKRRILLPVYFTQGVNIVMAEKRRLPDPEEMLKAKKRRKSLLRSLQDLCEQLRGIELSLLLESSAAIPDISEDQCIAWLVLKYGAQVVFSAASLHSTVPSTLTKHRRLLVIEKLCGDRRRPSESLSRTDTD